MYFLGNPIWCRNLNSCKSYIKRDVSHVTAAILLPQRWGFGTTAHDTDLMATTGSHRARTVVKKQKNAPDIKIDLNRLETFLQSL